MATLLGHPQAGAIVHAWRPSHWYTNMYEVGGVTPTEVTTWTVVPSHDTCWRTAQIRGDTAGIKYLGHFDSTAACTEAATAAAPRTVFAAFSYFRLTFLDRDFAGSCYGILSFADWNPAPLPGVDSGRAPGVYPMMNFSAGGDQGGEGEAGGAEWYIENVYEELDDANEFFFEPKSRVLYYVVNASSSAQPPSGVFTATHLDVLLNVSGSSVAPVKGLVLRGVEIADTRDTFMAPHGLPSGGDWALQKSAAVTLLGTEGVKIEQCFFHRLDGNGVFFGGYHRNASVSYNEFLEIGDSAIAVWGDTSTMLNANGTKTLPWAVGPDARDGMQSWGTRVLGNIAHEIGLFQKQSSFFFQALAARSVIQQNVFFNGPRAAVNFNDGHAGGDDLGHNLFVNSCRESGDHGPFNSWDRQPYITDFPGHASVVPLKRQIHHNYFMGNYNALFAVDTDDGSSYYEIHHNFLVSAGEGQSTIPALLHRAGIQLSYS